MFRPVAFVISPSRRACAAVRMPLAIRMRIMKWPGVGLRWNTPTHFSRSLSSSAMVRHPSRANRTRSSVTSRPSRSDFSASILFIGSTPSTRYLSDPPQAHGARLQLGLLRHRIAIAQGEVVGALVEAGQPAPVEGQKARALANGGAHVALRHRLAAA